MAWDQLTDEQREIRELVRTIAREKIAPRAAEIDESYEFPWDVVELYRENDIFGLFFDEEFGGLGTGTLLALIAIEEVSKVCATSGLILAVQELGSLGLKLAGTEEQRQRYLPKLAGGEWLCAYALTEAGSGSDSAAMRTTAKRDGDEYVLNGSKRFITNAGVANLYTVFAKTDPEGGHAGISAFVVEGDAPGFEVTRLEPKMGISGSTTGELAFDDLRIPAANLLGAEGEGFKIAMRILDRSRSGIAAQALGIDLADRLGRGSPEATFHRSHVREHDQHRCPQPLGEQRRGEILVDDRLDPVQAAAGIGDDRDASSAGADDRHAGVQQEPDGGELDDLERFRGGDHPAEAGAVRGDRPSPLAGQAANRLPTEQAIVYALITGGWGRP